MAGSLGSMSPLHEFSRLSENVSLYTPDPEIHSNSDMLIVLCTWMGASPKHIAKYTQSHMSLFPSARILLITNFLVDFFRSEAEYRRRLTPAVEVISEHSKRSILKSPDILVHSFSNGGANQLVELAKLFREKEGVAIPARAVMLDSSPGNASYWRSYSAMILSFPRNLISRLIGPPIIHLILIVFLIDSRIFGRENALSIIRRKLNDRNLLDQTANRLYLYSEADVMVWYPDVEEHANDALAKGMKVDKVKFLKSAHAAHILEDEQKYWDSVKGVWEARGLQTSPTSLADGQLV